MTTHSNQKAFTIVELIVAVAVTVLMLLLINTLFNDTSRAVSSGVGLSDIIGNERAIVNQINRDAARMLGPNSADPSGQGGGILIITNELISGADYLERNSKNFTRDVRADTIMWIANRTSDDVLTFQPIAPATTNSYDPIAPEKLDGSTGKVRIYYGHGFRTLPNGTGGAASMTDNGVANKWPLVRHASFFVPRDNSADPGDDPHWPHDLTQGGYVYSDSAAFNGALQNHSVAGATLRDGYTDLVDMQYFANAPIPANGAMLGNIMGSGALIHAQSAVTVPTTDAQYNPEAVKVTFHGTNRMRVNIWPELDETDPYPPHLIAQMHPLMATNVSDFIVEFAADTDFDGNIDVDANNNLEWYSISNPPSWTNTPTRWHDPGSVAGAFVFRHDYKDHWPYMIRIRYRLHDQRSSIQSEDPGATELGGGTFNGKWFEHIIRVERGN